MAQAEKGGRRAGVDEALSTELARGLSPAAAARAVGLAEATVHRRLADPEFRRRIEQRQGELLDDGLGLLGVGTLAATQTLVRLLGSTSETVKLSAARTLLAAGERAQQKQVDVLERRISTLEQAARGRPW